MGFFAIPELCGSPLWKPTPSRLRTPPNWGFGFDLMVWTCAPRLHWGAEYRVPIMRSRYELYCAKAEECSRQATLPQNAAQKDRLLKLAEEWTNMAKGAKNAPTLSLLKICVTAVGRGANRNMQP